MSKTAGESGKAGSNRRGIGYSLFSLLVADGSGPGCNNKSDRYRKRFSGQHAGSADSGRDESAGVSVVLADTEDTGRPYSKQMHGYQPPKLVLFNRQCGFSVDMPSRPWGFYCRGDQKVYIDLVFIVS